MSRLLVLVTTIILVAASIAPQGLGAATAAQPPGSSVFVRLTALQLPDGVRYSVVLLNPSDPGLSGVRIQVSLPEGSEVLRALEFPGRTQFLGLDGDSLAWDAPLISSSPQEVATVFSFFLARPLTADAHVRVTWSAGSTEISALPQPVVATASEGQLVVSPGGSGDDLLPVGDTGVRVRIQPGSIPAGTVLRFTRLGPETNPPGDGALWWCAALTVDGLPSGASILVLVPTRQALSPNAEVTLSAERAGTWEKLEQTGIVTGDGQFVAFAHPGGTVAAGTDGTMLGAVYGGAMRTAWGAAFAAARENRLSVSISGTSFVRSSVPTSHTITVENKGLTTVNGAVIWVRGVSSNPIDEPIDIMSRRPDSCLEVALNNMVCVIGSLPVATTRRLIFGGNTGKSSRTSTFRISVIAVNSLFFATTVYGSDEFIMSAAP